MRLLHTSDWHLGRLFHGVHLTEDQAHVLDQLVALVGDSAPDVVVIAGDVYDRSVPPTDAVALLDDTLTRIAVGRRTPVVMIAGNHDSPDRIEFGRRLMASSGVHVFGGPSGRIEPVVFQDEHGPVSLVALPYGEPSTVRSAFADEAIKDHQGAMAAMLAAARANLAGARRRVVVAHAFVSGGLECESERPLSVGGAASVSVDSFDGFDYVALGHLHRPQALGSERIAYSGSLLKYSFSEVSHRKSVSLVDIDAAGHVRVERIALSPRRDVRSVRGSLGEVLAGPGAGESRDDYVAVELTDRDAILDAMGRIRAVYPNCLHVDRSAFFGAAAAEHAAAGDRRHRTDCELFEDFVREVTGEPMTEPERAALQEAVESLARREREQPSAEDADA
jgi:exonuclease SbcD